MTSTRTWIARPLSVGDGVIGAEEGTPEEHKEQRKRAEASTDQEKAFSLRMYLEAEAEVARALGTKSGRL